ncbi:hypothetical protein EYF80_047700 [Liparis tanakae]|uniref:Uncharacterized protein n=1 Tax=Liparis tanakae TaxID=230148 RepID=A0A4Z2FM71_9TELE|nr:hypothetical protein EYF80_047700 [Liparis tanakae]
MPLLTHWTHTGHTLDTHSSSCAEYLPFRKYPNGIIIIIIIMIIIIFIIFIIFTFIPPDAPLSFTGAFVGSSSRSAPTQHDVPVTPPPLTPPPLDQGTR